MSGTGKSLLVFSREDEFSALLKERYTAAGYEVRISKSSEDALKQAGTQLPNCVLLDTQMSRGEDGLMFLRQLRSFRHDNPSIQDQVRRIPVIVLTSMDKAVRDLFEAEGIHGFFQKPYDPDLLNTQLLRAMGS